MPENKKGKEKGVEKERGTGVLRGEHDELGSQRNGEHQRRDA